MNRESFLDTIRQQYAEDIHEAYIECEHEAGEIDYAKLQSRLTRLMKTAKVDGLPEREFMDLVRSTLPEAAAELELQQNTQKAA